MFPLWALGGLSFDGCAPSTYPRVGVGVAALLCCVSALACFLMFSDSSVSSCLVPAPTLESSISPRSPDSFLENNWNKYLGTNRAVAIICQYFQSLLADKPGTVCGYTNVCIWCASYYTALCTYSKMNENSWRCPNSNPAPLGSCWSSFIYP